MGTPDGFKPRKMDKEKWKRIIQPDGDSDSSIDCWEDGENNNQRHQRQLAAIRLNRFLGNVGIPLRVPEDQEPGPSNSGNNEPQPGPSNSPNNNNSSNNNDNNNPGALRMSPPPVHMAQAPTLTSENASREQPIACMSNNMSSPRMPIGRLTLRHRRVHFAENASFENRMQRVRDRITQRHQQWINELPFANNDPYQMQRNGTPVGSNISSLRTMIRCGNNPDWLKLSGQSMSNKSGRGMYLPSSSGEPSTSYPEPWRIEMPPQENATNLSVPPSNNPEPPANEITENQTNETSEAPEEQEEPVAGSSTGITHAGEENETGPSAKKARTEEVGEQVSQPMQTLSDALNNSILSMLECPVCLDHMGPPIHQCRRGHLVCNNCRGQLIQCPTCRSRFIEFRNLALERIADLLRFPCKNDECGQSFKLKSKDEHELNCPWRVYKCMAHNCQWQGLHPCLLNHVQEQHSELILVGNSHNLDMPLDIAFTRNYVFYAWGELFRANMQRGPGNNTVHSLAQYLGPVAQASQFRFIFKLERTDSKGVVRSMVYERSMHSDNVRLSQAYAAGDCFCISIEQAKHFLSDRKVTLSVTLDKNTA